MTERILLSIATLLIIASGLTPAEAAQFTNSAQGYSLAYPDAWNTYVRPGNRGVSIRNFPPNETPEGGVVPPGGAVVHVQVFPPYDNPQIPQWSDDFDVLDHIASGNTVIARTYPASGEPARVTYLIDNLGLREVWTVRHLGGKAFLLSLVCALDDSRALSYEQVLDSIAASIALIAAPTPGISN